MNPDPSFTPFGPNSKPIDPTQINKTGEKKSEETDPNLEKDGSLLTVSKKLPKVDDVLLLNEEPIGESDKINVEDLVNELTDQESPLLLHTASTLMKATSKELLPAAETIAGIFSKKED